MCPNSSSSFYPWGKQWKVSTTLLYVSLVWRLFKVDPPRSSPSPTHTYTHPRILCRWQECWHAVERVCELFSVWKGVPRIPGKELREMESQHKAFSIAPFSNFAHFDFFSYFIRVSCRFVYLHAECLFDVELSGPINFLVKVLQRAWGCGYNSTVSCFSISFFQPSSSCQLKN